VLGESSPEGGGKEDLKEGRTKVVLINTGGNSFLVVSFICLFLSPGRKPLSSKGGIYAPKP
jgi:hypothetical protein